jgi:Ser/Thr protein kinase RdoA (MazF antagonist)
MDRFDTIYNALLELDSSERIILHNDYCMANKNMDDYIYDMDIDFDEVCEHYTPTDLALTIYGGKHFNPNEPYFYFNGYANLESCYPSEAPVFLSDIAGYIDRTGDLLGMTVFEELFEEDNDEDLIPLF